MKREREPAVQAGSLSYLAAYDCETGAICVRARSAATDPAWIRSAAKAARHTP